ncbi:transporter [Oceanisphaera profunda]|uniref:Transporter n=1 Tax=Oceanisphaera profunda TaxID=1416627 RepID=A0A1Y0D860_9GAMM|nr:ACT domain-containing protein [Oceanisphaera profunda]ART83739.1 transporter [Oceanisphaera profunda]
MSGITALAELLASMNPILIDDEFVFCTVPGSLAQYLELAPVASFVEAEGLTLVVSKAAALKANLSFDGAFRQITLTVHSSLAAVGLTAAVSTQLASKGISANVIAAFYHDHIFVPAANAEAALSAIQELSA